MAGQAAAVLDDEDDIPASSGGGSDATLRPVETPSIQHRPAQAIADDDFQIVETDDQGNDLEAPLTEDYSGGQPMIEAGRGAGAEDPESLIRARKLSRAQRRAKQKQGRDSTLRENAVLKAEVEQLRQLLGGVREDVDGLKPQLSELEKGRLQSSLNNLSAGIADETRKFNEAKGRLAQAVMEQNTDAFNKAMDDRDAAFIGIQRLNIQKQTLESAAAKAAPNAGANDGRTRNGDDRARSRDNASDDQGSRQPQTLAPETMARIEEFQQAYPWYTGNANDPDSRTVLWIDRMVAAEGLNPSTQDYWDAVEEKMEALLPHRFSEAAAPRQPAPRQAQNQQIRQPQNGQRRGPPTSAAGSAPGGASKNQVRISPARKQGMIDAGIIDSQGRVMNRDKFNRVLRQFNEYDRANGVG